MWLFAILVVLVMGAVAAVAAGRGTPMAEVHPDRPDALVPAEGPVTAEDLRRVRFSLAFRGYRMSEVDALLHRLAAEREREWVAGREQGSAAVEARVDPQVEPGPAVPGRTDAPHRPAPGAHRSTEPGPGPTAGADRPEV